LSGRVLVNPWVDLYSTDFILLELWLIIMKSDLFLKFLVQVSTMYTGVNLLVRASCLYYQNALVKFYTTAQSSHIIGSFVHTTLLHRLTWRLVIIADTFIDCWQKKCFGKAIIKVNTILKCNWSKIIEQFISNFIPWWIWNKLNWIELNNWIHIINFSYSCIKSSYLWNFGEFKFEIHHWN
jgi:hypothetical protein